MKRDPPRKRPLALRRLPRQDRSRATVDAILGAAAWVLVRDGWSGFTTNRVAARAGVNISSLYQFFPNKEAIVVELERRHVERTRAAMTTALAGAEGHGFEATLRALVGAYVAAHAVDPELQRVFAEQFPRLGAARQQSSAAEACVRDEAQAFLASSGHPMPRPELSTWLVATVCGAVAHAACLERRADVASGALVDELSAMVLAYLRS